MMHWGSTARRTDAFNSGRLLTWGAVLVVAGMALPSLRSGSATKLVRHEVRTADQRAEQTPVGAAVEAAQNRVKAFTTRSRMRGMRAELKMWTSRHGTTPTGSLADLVGQRTSKDAWGRTVQYLAPTSTSRGWLRSKGPDPKTDKDDVWLPLALSDFQ